MKSSISFVLVSHSRLAFHGVHSRVVDFITKRLLHFGYSPPLVVEGYGSAESAARDIFSQSSNSAVAITNVMNPILDLDLVEEMSARLERYDVSIVGCEGAVPGTQPEVLLSRAWTTCAGSSVEPQHRVRWFSQDTYNNQFDLYKYKRIKIFLSLIEVVPAAYALRVDELIKLLETDEIFRKLACYFEPIQITNYNECPFCHGALVSLPMRMSQPFCGYIPSSKPLYQECCNCGLIVSSPALDPETLPLIYDEFDKQDFVTSPNNPYMDGAPRVNLDLILDKLPANTKTINLGGGEGKFSEYLRQKFPNWDITHSDFESKQQLRLEQLGISNRALNILHDRIGENNHDLITAWEVIEHIPFKFFSTFLDNVYDSLSPGGFFVFSTPDFDSPLCRAFDFYAMCPPFHTVVFRKSWLVRYFQDRSAWWELFPCRSCSDFLDDVKMWCEYAKLTGPSFQLRATADVLGHIFAHDQGGSLKNYLLSVGIGTEVIMTLRKR